MPSRERRKRKPALRRRPRTARKALLKQARKGGLTVVLGAGVSVGHGLPPWGALVAKLWQQTYGDPVPAWLTSGEIEPHPLAFQMALEGIEEAWRRSSDRDPMRAAQNQLAAMLQSALYDSLSEPQQVEDDTLLTLVAALRGAQKQAVPAIRRVITFNVDDLVEWWANRGTSPGRPVVWPVPRASFHPRLSRAANDQRPIPIYHLHGYLPRQHKGKAGWRAAPDTLVFTDAQYWDSLSNPSSFANRVFLGALQDSRCVFVGLSMRDVNLMRWLGQRYCEVESDKLGQVRNGSLDAGDVGEGLRRTLDRHFWIRTRDTDPSGFVSMHLERRGISSVEIGSWGEPFYDLMAECFDLDEEASRLAAS